MKRSATRRANRLRSIAATHRISVAESPHASEKWNAPDVPLFVYGRSSRVVLNSGEAVPVRYAVVEADWLITSHHGLSYSIDSRYPTEAQPRDYRAEIELQLAVETRASSLDAWQILTDSVLSIDGPPVVRRDGVVVSGNGRMQSIRLAMERGLYTEVAEGIVERAAHFYLQVSAICGLKRPVLVRIMELEVTNPEDLARYGIEMNRDPGQGMSASEQSIALARLMTKEVVSQLSDLISSLPDGYSVRDFMRCRSQDIAVILSSGGLIDARKRSVYFTGDGNLTEPAKDLIETTLAGLTVTDIDVLRGASRPTRDRLVRAGVEFMRMRGADDQLDLATYNNQAVEILSEAEDRASYLRTMKRQDGVDAGSLVERLLHPERFTNHTPEMGFRSRSAIHPAVEALAMALELTPLQYVACINEYARRVAGAWRSMFHCLHPADAFTETIGTQHDPSGNLLRVLRVLPGEW
jgi:hypothetical protein